MTDFGDSHAVPGEYALNAANATEAVAGVAARSRVSVILGGDVAACLYSVRGLSRLGQVNVLHLGPRPLWGRGADGGPSGVLREVAALDGVGKMVIAGLRGPAGCGAGGVGLARSRASLLPARQLIAEGTEPVLRAIAAGTDWFVSLDVAALDPAIAPAVEEPSFGGLDYWQVTDLLTGLAARARVIGIGVFGISPERDHNFLTSRLAIRLTSNLLGAALRKDLENHGEPLAHPARSARQLAGAR
jgi:agmatinase